MDIDLNKARDIFLAAVEKHEARETDAFVAEACGTDEDLRHHVNRLIAAHRQSGSFIEKGALAQATVDQPVVSEGPGTQIGPYKLLEQIGEGGMGVVYMAQQNEPVKRRVALKIIKPGMDTQEVIARFAAERQALAMMDHPNIAKVLDAGQTDSDRPFFVMELVKGVPLVKYCDEQQLAPGDRLHLFISVCQAIQHAHQKGVIHRDIKPSNVLVALYDDQPVPKVIDFGVAKAIHQQLTERTMFTHYGQVVGTLEYMSPEQAKLNQLDIDTRSDIYSLGVLLYELLTGSTPIDSERLNSKVFDEILRAIREEDPPKPSTRISSSATLTALAVSRNTEPQKLVKLLRGDLDWIVMKAMAKQRGERYQTAEALAADVRCHLDDQPIEACRPSFVSRTRRYLRRNKVPVTLTTLVLLAFAAATSLGLIAYLGSRKREAELQARQVYMPWIERDMNEGRLVDAFLRAKEVKKVLPDDPAFRELWNRLTVTVTFDIRPPGTKVSIRDWKAAKNDPWLRLGESPLVNVSLPKGDLRFRYVKEGYLTREFQRECPDFLKQDGPMEMREDWGIPENMVLIDSVNGALWHTYWPKRRTDLGEFLVDRYEVTNRQYQAFIVAGGYDKREFWSDLEFVLDGKAITWQQAMDQFRDETTGHIGPTTWLNGRYPEGQDDYPVSGVSWFEAAAYAQFVGKSLPTLPHWQWAADTDQVFNLTALSNFSGRGPAARGTYQGIGRFDVYDLAGNVKEWCWNEDSNGHRCLRGGAWDESSYRFTDIDFASPWSRSHKHGFRCVKYLKEGVPPIASLEPWVPETGRPHDPTVRVPLDQLIEWYEYDDQAPLHAEYVKPESHLSDQFDRETVRIDTAYNDRFDVHLFRPIVKQDTYETIVWSPGLAAWLSTDFDHVDNTELEIISRLVATGRMIAYPVCEGMYERGNGEHPVHDLYRFKDLQVAGAKDVARTVDYLHTRSDVDHDRLVFMGYSAGAITSPRILVTKPNFRAAVLVTGGYPPRVVGPERAVYDPYQFTPHINIPVLMINGKTDPIATPTSEEFRQDLGSKNDGFTRRELLDCGHDPPPEDVVRISDQWLRDTLRQSR